MSAKPCRSCGKLIVFARDRQTGILMALTNQAYIWKPVPSKNGPMVIREPSFLSTHYCSQPDQPAATDSTDTHHFSEPKELPWSASE